MIYPNGVNESLIWNSDNTLSQISHKNGATVIEQSQYSYDGLGRRKTNLETLSGTALTYTYQYDSLDRLVSVANGAATQQESYGYDSQNNRVQKQIGNPVTATYAYQYDAAQQLTETHQTSLTGAMLEAYLYDNAGNQTQKCTGTSVTRASNTACTGSTVQGYVYNSFDKMTQITGATTASYRYDDQGRRIQKIEGANAVNYLYDGKNIYSEYASGSWATPSAAYVQAGIDHPLARLTGNVGDPSATAAYYHQDGLGSVLAATNAAKAVTASQRFGAFGNIVAASGTIAQYGYTGREPDASGMIYYRARYYDANGRFTQRDSLGYADGINPYLYVHNNPINFNDPNGLLANQVSNAWTAGISYFSSNPGAAADIGVGFTPAGVYADVYGAATGKTLFGGQQLSGWERGLGLIPMVSESIGVVRGANKVDNIVNAGQDSASALLAPYGGPGGGHHVPAKSAFDGATGYDINTALAIPNLELANLGVSHSAVTGAQMTGYQAFAKTGGALTWEAMATIETNALVRGGMNEGTAGATVNQAIQALKDAGVAGPTRIPWGK